MTGPPAPRLYPVQVQCKGKASTLHHHSCLPRILQTLTQPQIAGEELGNEDK